MRCQAYRWVVSRTIDRGRSLPGWAHRHEAACAACHAYRAQVQGLVRVMGTTRELDQATGSRLHERVMNAVRRSGSAAPEAPARAPAGWALVAAAAVAVIVVAGMVTAVRRPHSVASPLSSQSSLQAEGPSINVDIGYWFTASYEREWGRLADDMESSGAFLADCVGWEASSR